MIRYTTVAKEALCELTIERSRFIARIAPASSKEEAEDYIKRVRAFHRDASHNVPAFIIGEKGELQWASDDGEPQGTSGPPILQMLAREGLSNLVCVVTRYFGGIKLGTGGLVRAYTESAKMALEAAGRRQVRDVIIWDVALPYTALSRLQRGEKEGGYLIRSVEYAEAVSVCLQAEPEDEEALMSMLGDISAGRVLIKSRKSAVT